jgi:hypothetical protein
VVSTEDTGEIWKSVKEETMEKVRGRANRGVRGEDSSMTDETEVEKSFWIRRTDGWEINRKTKKVILLEFKRTIDCGEGYFQDMWRVTDKQHTPILTLLNGSSDPDGRTRMGGRSRPTGRRTSVGQKKGVD